MPRLICPTCERASKVCLCPYITPIENRIELGILQHPSEVSQVKGTAKIAQLAFKQCTTWIGEDLDKLPELQRWLQDEKTVFLLYPGIENQAESFEFFSMTQIQSGFKFENIKLLILDGTWRKTHKMMMLNTALRGLNRLVLEPTRASAYQIRKQKSASSLSTVEAIYQSYSQLESNSERYQPLLTAFESMQKQQLAFREPLSESLSE